MCGPTVESKCSRGERLYGCVVLLWSPSVACGERLYGCVVLLWSPSVPVVRDCMDVWSYCGVQVFLW